MIASSLQHPYDRRSEGSVRTLTFGVYTGVCRLEAGANTALEIPEFATE